jgi:hypothetical protein
MSNKNHATTVATEIETPFDDAPESATAMLPLDLAREIRLGDGKTTFIYRFRRITLKDWREFFGAIVHRSLQVGAVKDTVYESDSAAIDLVGKNLISVEGYGSIAGVKNWRQSLPLRHRIAVGIVLRSVGLSDILPDSHQLSDVLEVRLDATWSADEAGKMTTYAGLVHRFRQPTIEQLRKFNFETARVRVEGTQESGITTYPSRQLVAMQIYDELIESVEGYSVGGNPLEGIENIQREMDGAHKAEAALSIFTQGAQVQVL